jgi:hypothetical protein
MDWIADALNDALGVCSPPPSNDFHSSNSNGTDNKTVDDYLTPPNFDHLLSRSQDRRGNSHHVAESTTIPKKAHVFLGAAPSDVGVIRKLNGNTVRIHPTDMQLYLRGLLQSTVFPDDMGMESSPMTNNNKEISKQVSMMSANDEGNDDRPTNNDPNFSADDSKSGPPADSTSPAPSASIAIADGICKKIGGGIIRQKNDKAVEVYKGSTLVARFKTQTECARYLRATPEAVSYHCSRGGGACNGLQVRPIASAGIGGNDDDRFGLFEGSVSHRPQARPQLSPHVVSLLKAWLLSPSHINNPYPNTRDYEMLMEMTKLDKMQLKHWFNNARKRILKPLLKNKDLKSSGRIESIDISTIDLIAVDSKKKKRKSDADDLLSDDGTKAIASSKKAKAERDMAADLLRVAADSSAKSSQSSESRGTQKMNSNLSGLSQSQRLARQQQHDDADSQAASLLFQQGNGGVNINAMMGGRFDQLMGFNNGGGGNMLFNVAGNAGLNPMMGYGDIMGAAGFASVNRARGLHGMDSIMMDSSVNPLLRGYNQGMGDMYGRGGGLRGGPASFFCGGMGDINDNTLNRDIFPLSSEHVAEDSVKNDLSAVAAAFQSSDEAARSNAMFKQQVAAMAMTEASVAFKEMEDAFAQAKAMVAQSCTRWRSDEATEDDEGSSRLLFDANARATKCQSIAMFKLKVSQRASEEAAAAYSAYEALRVDGGGRLMSKGGSDLSER